VTAEAKGRNLESQKMAGRLAGSLGLDMTQWWQPTNALGDTTEYDNVTRDLLQGRESAGESGGHVRAGHHVETQPSRHDA
jgi:hypothetical protein